MADLAKIAAAAWAPPPPKAPPSAGVTHPKQTAPRLGVKREVNEHAAHFPVRQQRLRRLNP